MRFALCTPILLFSATTIAAANIDGRLTTSLYTYEGLQTDTTTTNYARVYQSARLNIGDLIAPQLSFHSYFQGTTDLGQQADSDPRLRLYHAYLAWKDASYNVQVGRQRVYAGVGYGSIDGARARLKRGRFALLLYGGALVPVDRGAAIGRWDEGQLWGGRVSAQGLFGSDLSLSFAHHQRRPDAYATKGRYSGLTLSPSAVERRLVGVDARRRFAGGHSLYARFDYDLQTEQLRRSELSGRYAFSPRLSAQLDWFRRAPNVFYNSIFSAFPSTDYQEIASRLHYRASANLHLSASFAQLLYDGDSAQRLGLVASIGNHYSLGYYRTMGYARQSDGLVGNIHYPLTSKLLLRGELDLAAYERYEDAVDRDELLTGALGLNWRPTRRAQLELGLQGLRNPLDHSDTRLFLRCSWRFSRRNT